MSNGPNATKKFFADKKLSEILTEDLKLSDEFARLSLEVNPPTTGSDYTHRWYAYHSVGIRLRKALELEQRVDSLLALLRELEFGCWVNDGEDWSHGCPICGNEHFVGKHQADCRLAIAIGGERWEE